MHKFWVDNENEAKQTAKKNDWQYKTNYAFKNNVYQSQTINSERTGKKRLYQKFLELLGAQQQKVEWRKPVILVFCPWETHLTIFLHDQKEYWQPYQCRAKKRL